MATFLGIDVGSVSTNAVLVDHRGVVMAKEYLRTQGRPITAIQTGLQNILQNLDTPPTITAAGTTGSGRVLASVIIGADVVKNEITAHAVAAMNIEPKVQTVMEIGGQDSKIIILRNGIVTDFAMNTVCAAGTGSFLDQQAARLGIPIAEFGELALQAKNAVRIAGRCAVFAESDMIHKQQLGYGPEAIISGLCEALVRNYLNNVGKGKELLDPVLFQGGVAANHGMRRAFAQALETEIVVPEHFDVMGAYGAAVLAREHSQNNPGFTSSFRGWQAKSVQYQSNSFTCTHCANECEVVEIYQEKQLLARWGGRCPRWETESVSQNR